MRLEFLSTGNELLDGSVVDTNVAFFAERVHALGHRVASHLTLPDDLEAIASALRAMGERADLAVVSGGLGPTLDDLTIEAAAQAADVSLALHEPTLARVRERLAKRGMAFTPNNARVARVPAGAEVVENPVGTAPLSIVKIGRAMCFFLPGVPREFEVLCAREVMPRVERAIAEAHTGSLAGKRETLFAAARVLKTIGLPESHLDALAAPLLARHPWLSMGTRTKAPENHLKLRATGATREEARQHLELACAEASALLAEHLFGADDDEFAQVLLRELTAANATVAMAESCTAGLCASLLASAPGASRALRSSAVVYSDEAKSDLLGLERTFVARNGAVSEPVTRALAEAARARAGATYGLGITGYAGPSGGTQEDPVGTVYISLANGSRTLCERHCYAFERERLRHFAASRALELLWRELRGALT